MAKIIECSIIIKDDFKNVFIVQRKSKRKEPKLWYLLGKKVKGKETEEKCINKAIKEDLKAIIFNLKPIFELDINDLESCLVYQGELKERIVYGTEIIDGKWISEREIDNYDFAPYEKEKLIEYFKK
ncbi:hypothetical protein [Clostridium sp.]|uniref:hypothetical protein n=1 Tax=Clostridium sp. TaxID=1506 RepID=UPI0026198423|nr:hypothetical protein [Clostridium sp.]